MLRGRCAKRRTREIHRSGRTAALTTIAGAAKLIQVAIDAPHLFLSVETETSSEPLPRQLPLKQVARAAVLRAQKPEWEHVTHIGNDFHFPRPHTSIGGANGPS